MDCSLPSSSVQALAWNSPGQNSGLGFPRQEYWSGWPLPFPSPGDLLHTGIEPSLTHCRQILYCVSHWEVLRHMTSKNVLGICWEYLSSYVFATVSICLVLLFFLLKQISQKKTFGLVLEFCFWKLQFCIQFLKIHTKLFRFSVCVCVCVWLIVLFKNVSISSKSLMYCYKIFKNEFLPYLIFICSLNVLNISISFFMLITWWEYFLSLMLLAGMCAC